MCDKRREPLGWLCLALLAAAGCGAEPKGTARNDYNEEAVRLASPSSPLESRPFDVILMDLKMPGLDGYEATRRLRRLEAECGWSPTPIVALTADALEESRRSCMAAGFNAFLAKPVDYRALATTLDRVCATGGALFGDQLAEAATRTGDDDDLVLQVLRHTYPSYPE